MNDNTVTPHPLVALSLVLCAFFLPFLLMAPL